MLAIKLVPPFDRHAPMLELSPAAEAFGEGLSVSIRLTEGEALKLRRHADSESSKTQRHESITK